MVTFVVMVSEMVKILYSVQVVLILVVVVVMIVVVGIDGGGYS